MASAAAVTAPPEPVGHGDGGTKFVLITPVPAVVAAAPTIRPAAATTVSASIGGSTVQFAASNVTAFNADHANRSVHANGLATSYGKEDGTGKGCSLDKMEGLAPLGGRGKNSDATINDGRNSDWSREQRKKVGIFDPGGEYGYYSASLLDKHGLPTRPKDAGAQTLRRIATQGGYHALQGQLAQDARAGVGLAVIVLDDVVAQACGACSSISGEPAAATFKRALALIASASSAKAIVLTPSRRSDSVPGSGISPQRTAQSHMPLPTRRRS
jgi:hypothetical protein